MSSTPLNYINIFKKKMFLSCIPKFCDILDELFVRIIQSNVSTSPNIYSTPIPNKKIL